MTAPLDPNRGTGRTTAQMLAAPHRAVFVWTNNTLTFAKNLARKLGREDLHVVGPSWLENSYGLTAPAVVIDHAANLNARQRAMAFNLTRHLG